MYESLSVARKGGSSADSRPWLETMGLMAIMVLYLIYTGIYTSEIKLTFRKKQVHEQQLVPLIKNI